MFCHVDFFFMNALGRALRVLVTGCYGKMLQRDVLSLYEKTSFETDFNQFIGLMQHGHAGTGVAHEGL